MKAKVTFEFQMKQPVTAAVEVEDGTASGMASRAVRAAQMVLKGNMRGWTSIVVLIEREAADADETEG